MADGFRITRKHYNTILEQGIKNLPEESGGFLGGYNQTITGILPIFNQYLYNRTDTFGFTSEDIQLAHRFFAKHGLSYYGLYHTHPKGIAYPSQADINSGQLYHFILSLQNQDYPVFSAFHIHRNQPISIPLHIISDKGFSSVNLNETPQASLLSNRPSGSLRFDRPMTPEEEKSFLHQKIQDIKNETPLQYPLLKPKDTQQSDFSTLA